MKTIRVKFHYLFLAAILLVFPTSAANAQFSNSPKPKPSKIPSKLVLGQVVDQDDQPIPSAIVNLTNLKTSKISQDITDDKGEFRFGGLSPEIDYDVQTMYHNAMGPKERVSIYDTRGKREFYWKLPLKLSDSLQEVNLLFVVSDTSGKPIPGATLKFTSPNKIETLTAVTDASGRTQKWLSSDRSYSVVASAPDHETFVQETLKPDRNAELVRVVLKPSK
ncbi:MAG: carboxypeptidase-like regulatory domain-containing protein [Acidobacteriia bacterium]|nr:carboxypeptidase-like regulatory domain-containing protein [Terriglobia bacterium]